MREQGPLLDDDGGRVVRVPDLRRGGMLEQALATLPTAALVTDPDQRIVYLNAAFERLTGYTLAELAGRNCRVLQGPDSDPSEVRAIREALGSGRPYRGTLLNYTRTGEPFWNGLSITPILDGTGALVGFVGAQTDESGRLEERRRSEDQLAAARRMLAAVPRSTAPDTGSTSRAVARAVLAAGAERAALAVEQPDGRLRMVAWAGWAAAPDDAAVEVGLLAGALDAASPVWTHRADAGPDRAAALDALGVERVLRVPVAATSAARAVLVAAWAEGAKASPADDVLVGRMLQLAELGGGALDTVHLIARTRELAERDPLTGAAARFAVQARLEEALALPGGTAAVLFLDVDRFKRINDSLGHAAGDLLLVRVTERIASVVGDAGVVGRHGGDEFVVVLPAIDDRRAREIQDAVAEAMRAPFRLAGRTVYATAASGRAVGRAEPGESAADAAERLVQEADAAMYVAKERTRARPVVDTSLDVVLLESDLHHAIDRGEISTVFQPQFDGRTGRLVGFEALARWRHPDCGPVPPEVFIPLAEESGTIFDIGRRVLGDAVAFADRAVRRYGPLRLAVNVSKHELLDPAFVGRVEGLLDGHRDRGWALTAEVTEPELVDGDSGLARSLAQLRALDVDIAVDDFGSGFSSLATLQDLPITSIKIDETFLRRTGALGGGMIAAIVSLGLGLGLEVMAEGVESLPQLDALRALGCGRLQGYVLSPPLAAEEALLVPATIDRAVEATARAVRPG